MITLNTIPDLIIYIALISAVAERITASVKFVVNLDSITNEKTRLVVIHALAFSTALLAAILNPPSIPILQAMPKTAMVILVAILGSTGSNVWHDLLSTLGALKDKAKSNAVLASSTH